MSHILRFPKSEHEINHKRVNLMGCASQYHEATKNGYNKIYQKSVLILVVAGKGGECPKAKLEGEHNLDPTELDLDAHGGDVDGSDAEVDEDVDRPEQPPQARPLAR